MPLHWTYAKYRSYSDLAQGDIIGYTDELRGILSRYHSHFVQDKYWGFLVLTQTCDLVRRPPGKAGRCGAAYVSMAVIRPIDDLLASFCDHVCRGPGAVCGTTLPGTFYEGTRGEARNLLSRILNQNEQALGLFYLHPDEAVGIAEPCVALLRVSISLHANEHYICLLKSRKGRLDREFQPKLGWLVGNLYSRVATPDWERKQLQKEIDQLLDVKNPLAPCWVSHDSVQAAAEQALDLRGLTTQEAVQMIQSCRKPAAALAQERIEAVARAHLPHVADDELRRFLSAVRNDKILQSILSDADKARRRSVP